MPAGEVRAGVPRLIQVVGLVVTNQRAEKPITAGATYRHRPAAAPIP